VLEHVEQDVGRQRLDAAVLLVAELRRRIGVHALGARAHIIDLRLGLGPGRQLALES
jgi:hypothetical protein